MKRLFFDVSGWFSTLILIQFNLQINIACYNNYLIIFDDIFYISITNQQVLNCTFLYSSNIESLGIPIYTTISVSGTLYISCFGLMPVAIFFLCIQDSFVCLIYNQKYQLSYSFIYHLWIIRNWRCISTYCSYCNTSKTNSNWRISPTSTFCERNLLYWTST